MLSHDISIANFLNGLVGSSVSFDNAMVYLSDSNLFKLTPMILILWGFWFKKQDNNQELKRLILRGLIGCMFAMVLARALALVLPFRVRPIHNPELALRIPAMLERGLLDGWSSLPSDHAALAFAIATVIFLIHRAWGAWALLHATLIICFPRAYLGLHYPTDLFVGALVGIFCSYFSMRVINTNKLVDFFLSFERTRPAAFYVAALFVASQIMQMFNGIRGFGSIVAGMLRPHL